MLCGLAFVPHAAAMLVPAPAGLDPIAIASAADNVADGYRAVAPHLSDRPTARARTFSSFATTVIDWDAAPTRYLDDAIKLVVAR